MKKKKLVFASDSFKGSLSSYDTIELLTSAAKEVFGDVDCVGIPVADGGEGTVDALIAATGGSRIYADVHDPLMGKITAYFGKLDDKKAVIEMAAASGLTLLPIEKRNPLLTTTFGTGELIKVALDQGFTDLYVSIGGSATNDGGMGCARALGIKFLDTCGNELEGRGQDLEKVAYIDVSGLDVRIKKCKITVLCDVNNPLCGENGATYVFSAQKGADKEMREKLEKGMINYRNVIRRQFGIDPDSIPGGGAAGGLGTMLKVFLGGEMRPGIDTVLDLTGFDSIIKDADLVVTGEGCTDLQSCYGKAICGIGERAKKAGVPAIALSGSLGPGAEEIYKHGICSLVTTSDTSMTIEYAMLHARELYHRAAVKMFTKIQTDKTGF